jgi:polyisoprenoid-binding protein YceI
MHRTRRFAAIASAVVVLALSSVSTAAAQPAADAAAAPAGTYTVDRNHTAVIARVSHGGFSYEVFRFGDVAGTLVWDPADPSKNSLSVTVQTASIATPVENFAVELSEPRFLNVAQFPQATFVSSAFHKTDASHGRIDGTLTIKGVAKPVTFDVTLIGAGTGQRGANIIGYTATTATPLSAGDYNLPAFINGPIVLTIDGEFNKR